MQVVKSRPFILALALTMTLAPAIAESNPKQGAKCPSAGATRVYQGLKFTCVKRGKQLLWGKGVPVIRPAASPSPSPTATRQPSKLELLSQQNSIQGQALSEFLRFPKSAAEVTSPFEFVFSPNSDPAFQKLLKDLLDVSWGYFAEFYNDTRKFPIVYGTDEDFEWFMNYMETNRIAPPYMRSEYEARLQREGKQVNIGGSDTWDGDKNQINIVRGKFRNAPGEADFAFIAHEFTHALQNVRAGGQAAIPCWSAEGAAQFFGSAISARYFAGDFERMKYWTFQMVSEAPQRLDPWNFTDTQWLDTFTRLERRGDLCSYDARISYAPGFIMTELMIADRGIPTLMEWWSTGRSAEGWRAGFKRLYGMSVEDWYLQKALPAVKQAHRDIPKR